MNEVILAVGGGLPLVVIGLLNLAGVSFIILVEIRKLIELCSLLRVKVFVLVILNPVDVLRSGLLVVLSVHLASVIDNANVHLGWQHMGGKSTLLDGHSWHWAVVISPGKQVRALGRNLLLIGELRLLRHFRRVIGRIFRPSES